MKVRAPIELGLVAVALAATFTVLAQSKDLTQKGRRPAPAAKLEAPEYLSTEARFALHRKMENHARDMMDVMMAVTLLRYAETAEIAQRIATEPRLTRPIAGGEDDVNAALPERFFVLQDELRVHASALRDAANAKDDAALANAFADLSRTCVGCHSAYLRPPR